MTHADERTDAFAHSNDGVAVAYQRHGSGPPLVLLAGQANNHHWWDGMREDWLARHPRPVPHPRGTPTCPRMPDAPT